MSDQDETVRSSSYRPPKILPPCRVCGEKGSGLHYGVNTCDACKGFFQRGSSRKSWPLCIHQRQCTAAKTRKMMCATCRFQKCVELGMSKKAIKTGRYTYEQKTLYTHEVAKLSLEAKVGSEEVMMLTDEERRRELDEIVERITCSHLEQVPDNRFLINLRQREEAYMKYKSWRDHVFGPLTPITPDEHRKIYHETGLDIGNRRKLLAEYFNFIDKSIKRSISFIKVLPGFKTLPVVDQMALVKACQFECDLMRHYHICNVTDRIWNNPDNWDQMLEASEMAMLYDQSLIDQYVPCVEQLQQLDMTPEEQAVLNAYLVVTAAADLTPEGSLILSSIQEVISDALCHVISKHHDRSNRFMARLISLILKIKQLRHACVHVDRPLLQQTESVGLTVPETLKEINSLT